MQAWRLRGGRAAIPLIVLALSGFGWGCGGVDPVDVVVYADHLPSFFKNSTNGSPQTFSNPFVDAKFGGHTEYPDTRIVVKPVPGMQLPQGNGLAWGHVSWGKYVITGYHGGDGIEDQRVGVFNTETHEFCTLDLDPY